MMTESMPFDPTVCTWDRPGIGAYDDGSVRIIKQMPNGDLVWCRKPTPEEGRWIFDFEQRHGLARNICDTLAPPPVVSIQGELPDDGIIYFMVAYGTIDSGWTFFGPFEEKDAIAYRDTCPGAAEVIQLEEARVMDKNHGTYPLTKRGYKVAK